MTDRIAEGDLTSAVPEPQTGSRDELRALLARLATKRRPPGSAGEAVEV
nr:hypothetical protein [Acidovorax temperans]